jgi:hypothetical protein
MKERIKGGCIFGNQTIIGYDTLSRKRGKKWGKKGDVDELVDLL